MLTSSDIPPPNLANDYIDYGKGKDPDRSDRSDRSESAPADHLREWWTQNLRHLHSAAWWRQPEADRHDGRQAGLQAAEFRLETGRRQLVRTLGEFGISA
jgi:hypothetical protein